MTEAEELEQIEADVAELGKQMLAKRDRALEILKGRVATVRERKFIIRSAKPYFGGINTRLFFEGPQLKQDGSPHARACESAPLGMIDAIGPAVSEGKSPDPVRTFSQCEQCWQPAACKKYGCRDKAPASPLSPTPRGSGK